MPKIQKYNSFDELDELPRKEHIKRRPKNEELPVKKNDKKRNEFARRQKEFHEERE